MIPNAIAEEVALIKATTGLAVEAHRNGDGYVHVVIERYALPKGYSKPGTRLLVKLPASYPNGSPDMFWTDADLRLASGGFPEKARPEPVGGETWLRFSWHPKGWNPGRSNLATYLEFVEHRIRMVR